MAPRKTSKPVAALKQTTLGPPLFKSKSASSTASVTVPSSTEKKRRPAKPDASGRVQSDVLLAILPIHLQRIAKRQKNHEYRKYRLQDGVERLWLYETRGTREDPGRAAITYESLFFLFSFFFR